MAMRIGTKMPSFDGATEWINGSQEQAAQSVQGSPTLIHFWSASCGICKENMPRIHEWREKRKDQGLKVVAVHMPLHPEDTDITAVREAIENHNITETVAIDNNHALRDAFKNDQGHVPAYYLFDAEGKLKGYAAGARGLNMLSASLDRMMANRANSALD